MRRKLDPVEDTIRGVSNFTRRIKGMYIFIGNFIYVVDFMIVEDISSIIDPRLSQVVLGKPFVEISNMTHDLSLGEVRLRLVVVMYLRSRGVCGDMAVMNVGIQLLVHVVIPSHINAAFTYDICIVRTRKVTTIQVKKRAYRMEDVHALFQEKGKIVGIYRFDETKEQKNKTRRTISAFWDFIGHVVKQRFCVIGYIIRRSWDLGMIHTIEDAVDRVLLLQLVLFMGYRRMEHDSVIKEAESSAKKDALEDKKRKFYAACSRPQGKRKGKLLLFAHGKQRSIQLLVHVVIPSHINAAFTYDICTVRTRKVTTVRVKKVCTVRIIREKCSNGMGTSDLKTVVGAGSKNCQARSI
ncbi:hypothetical protein Tco_0602272 [Tanacetum coccineum]